MTGADITATFCATLVDEWVRAGVTHAVVAPGSRSTPLALALAGDGRLRVHVHHDERAAGFLALGIGRATGRPAVALTTSGTAAVEVHPAVVEAHHARVPLVVVTADRPPELRDVGAPQTIDQVHLFGRAVRWYAEPGVPDEAARLHWRPLAARAILEALGSPPGPVHLNVAFREPLIGVAGPLPPGRPTGVPWQGRARGVPVTSALEVAALAGALRGRRGLIVAGDGIAGPDGPDAVHALAERLRWPVLADPRSGCRVPRPLTVSHADALLRVEGFAGRMKPEVVLRLGSAPASRIVGSWLAGSGAWHLEVDAHGARHDPDATLAASVAAEPGELCSLIVDELGPAPVGGAGSVAPEGWGEAWAAADAQVAAALRGVLAAHGEPTEPAIARDVMAGLADGAHLVVSSSMPVRDLEWYAAPREGVVVHANRGANGIDGVMATALGVAIGSGDPTVALIGDVAFLYDANALAGATRRGVDLVAVVVDNDGGGIFSFLPQAGALDDERFELLFGTPHGTDLVALAAAHGVPARRLDRQADVGPAVATSLALGGVHVLVVGTDRGANVVLHDEIHAAAAEALEGTVPNWESDRVTR
jgi:2-succinyl-5-enolpyruvyl-6-hydroxy-3-cyclohexene-1-carboxylate synthase